MSIPPQRGQDVPLSSRPPSVSSSLAPPLSPFPRQPDTALVKRGEEQDDYVEVNRHKAGFVLSYIQRERLRNSGNASFSKDQKRAVGVQGPSDTIPIQSPESLPRGHNDSKFRVPLWTSLLFWKWAAWWNRIHESGVGLNPKLEIVSPPRPSITGSVDRSMGCSAEPSRKSKTPSRTDASPRSTERGLKYEERRKEVKRLKSNLALVGRHLSACGLPYRLFFLMIDNMGQSLEIASSYLPGGVWLPPRVRCGNLRKDGDTTGVLFAFDGTSVLRLNTTPEELGLTEYRTVSMYHDQSRFWAVPFDATATGANPTEDDYAANSKTTTEAGLHPLGLWALVGFDYDKDLTNTYTSYITIQGPQPRLLCQRPFQRWPKCLLPPNFHASLFTPDEYSQYGGLLGNLNIILGLIAFSVRPSRVEHILSECLRDNQWRDPHIPNSLIGHGCKYHWHFATTSNGLTTRMSTGRDRRGIIVRIWTGGVQGSSTPEELALFEAGYHGKIFA